MRDDGGSWLGPNPQCLQEPAKGWKVRGLCAGGPGQSWVQPSGAMWGQTGDQEAWEEAMESTWERMSPEPGPWGQTR